jgi:hypothetical protein
MALRANEDPDEIVLEGGKPLVDEQGSFGAPPEGAFAPARGAAAMPPASRGQGQGQGKPRLPGRREARVASDRGRSCRFTERLRRVR